MRGLLRPTGSIYLHCDPTAGHYIKVLMDAVFGHKNFINEIVWKRTSSHSDAKRLGSVHDVLLWYAASDKHTYNKQFLPYDEEYIEKRHRHTDPDGRRWMDDNLSAKGLRGGGYEYEYKGVTSMWRVPPEKMKQTGCRGPLAFHISRGFASNAISMRCQGFRCRMYGRISRRSIPKRRSDLLCHAKTAGTTGKDHHHKHKQGCRGVRPLLRLCHDEEAAHKLERQWIGIDIAIHAIKRVAKVRLSDRLRLAEVRITR